MCLFFGIYLWLKHGGKLLIIFQPCPHVVVCSKGLVWHGTNKHGTWSIENIERDNFVKWLIPNTGRQVRREPEKENS